MTAVAILLSCFIAAYGNAMGKVIVRRELAVEQGRTVHVPGRVYAWSGRVLFWIGVAGAAAAVAFLVIGR